MSSPRRVRLQNIVPNSNIVIDHWDMKSSQEHDPRIRFMTSIKHHSVKSMSHLRKAKYSIHTSLFNKWYLHQFYGISENRIIVLDINKTVEIYDPHRKEKFCVTAIEANYCSGSTMFLFQGSFGNILYTGYFRTSSAAQIYDSPAVRQLIVEKSMHVAYIDNSYAAEHCTFPTRHETIQKIIQLIRCSKNCDIIISTKPLGKEEVLLAIASELEEKIHVGSQRYKIFNKLGVSDFFTRNLDEARIRALDELLSLKECYQRFDENKSCVIILLTALYAFGPKKLPIKPEYLPRLHIIPYSGHCNYSELKQFVSSLRPHTIFPIIKYRSEQLCSVIPQSIYDLCYKESDVRDTVETTFLEPIDEKYLPIVLIPRILESPKTRSRDLESEFTPSAEDSFAEVKRTKLSVSAVSAPAIANEECPKETSETCENSCYSPQWISMHIQVPAEDVATAKESYSVEEECRAISNIDENVVEYMAEERNLEQNPQMDKLLGGPEVSSVAEYVTAVDVPNNSDVGTSNLTTVRSPLQNIFIRDESCDVLTDFTRPNSVENMDCTSDEMQPFSMVQSDDSICNDDQLVDEYIIEELVPINDDADKFIVTTPHSRHDDKASEDAPSGESSEENAKQMDSLEMEINLNEVDRVECAKSTEQIPRIESYQKALESGSNSSDSPTKLNKLLPLHQRNVQFEGEEIQSITSPKSSSNRIFPPREQEMITVTLTVDANYVNPRSESTTRSSENGVHSVCSDVCNLLSTSNRDVSDTLFEIDEHCSNNLRPINDTESRVVESSASVVESISVVQSDSCQIIESDRFPNNSSEVIELDRFSNNSNEVIELDRFSNNSNLALERSRTDGDAQLSDSSDCVIVEEYISKAGSIDSDRHTSKKLRLDSAQRNDTRNVSFPKKNDLFVNAILFHYCKLYDSGNSTIASDQWGFLSDCNIFSHPAYRR